MNAFCSRAKRCMALVLTLVLLLSGSNLGYALAAQTGDPVSTTVAHVMAGNYALSEAEKGVLTLLQSDGITYTTPGAKDNLVTVDLKEKTITAADYRSGDLTWTAATAQILVNNEVAETVTFNGETAAYEKDHGKAFYIYVNYELKTQVDTAVQEGLLNAVAALKQGLSNADAVSEQAGNLYILETAMPELVDVVKTGIVVTVNGTVNTISFSDDCKAAVERLNAQMTANENKLNLSVMAGEYSDGTPKTEYLRTKGAAMQAEVVSFAADLAVIESDMTEMVNTKLPLFIQLGYVSQEKADQIKTLAEVAGNLRTALAVLAKDPWTAANDTGEVYGAGSARLDTAVAALGDLTNVTVQETLEVDKTTVQCNLSMHNVTVKVVLRAVGEDNTVKEMGTYTAREPLTLDEGISSAEIQKAIDNSGIVSEALTGWNGLYAEGHFQSAATKLPDTLTEDLEYTITYSPKNYKVTYAYAPDASVTLPYGTAITLEKHEDGEKAYDYMVGGDKLLQGSSCIITGDVTIDRVEVKAYRFEQLYAIIADNYSNSAKTAAILASGALKGDETVAYHPLEVTEDLVTLVGQQGKGLLTAKTFPSDYQGLIWTPYSCSVDGGEAVLFDGKTEITLDMVDSGVTVTYRLTLDNYGKTKTAELLALAKTLSEEAGTQKVALDTLSGDNVYSNMGVLDRVKLGALNGVISVTELNSDPEKDAALKNEFTAAVSTIINNHMDGDVLKIYKMLGQYREGGLSYYYKNSDSVIGEITALSECLSALTNSEDKIAALKILVSALEYPEYADKINDLNQIMESGLEALKVPNAAIDVNSADLDKLTAALTGAGEIADPSSAEAPYLTQETTENALHAEYVFKLVDVSAASAQVSLTSYLDSQSKMHFVVAAYNADGKLVAQNLVSEQLSWGEARTLTLSCPKGETITLVKGFILESGTYKPLYPQWEKVLPAK